MQQVAQVLQLEAQQARLLQQARVGGRGLEERLAHVVHPVPGLGKAFPHPLRPALRLAHAGTEGAELRPLVGREPVRIQRLDLEGHGTRHGLEHAIDLQGQAGLVAAGGGQGAVGAVVPGIPLVGHLQPDRRGAGEAQVPGQPVQALPGLAADAAENLAVGGADGQHGGGLRLPVLGPQGVPGRHDRILARLDGLLLLGLALLLLGPGLGLHVVGEHRAEGRVGRQEERVPLEGLPGSPEGHGGDIGQGGPQAEEVGLPVQVLGLGLTQGRKVIQDVEAAAEGGHHQVPFPGLDGQILHGDGRQVLEPGPDLARVEAEVEAELRAAVEQPLPRRVLPDGVDAAALGQAGPEGLPAAAAVPGAQQVGLEVPGLVVVQGGVDRSGLVRAGRETGDVGLVRHAREAVQLAPGLTAVLAGLQEAVVGARVEQPLGLGTLRQGHDVAEEAG